jgi:uncharacterized repeat protein (TIGR03803 family)
MRAARQQGLLQRQKLHANGHGHLKLLPGRRQLSGFFVDPEDHHVVGVLAGRQQIRPAGVNPEPARRGTDGADPHGAALIQTTSGDLYGTTGYGGANQQGTVFKIAPDGTLTTLYSFCSQSGCTDGANPFGRLLQGADGDFYGTTHEGGAAGYGTVFKITPSGTLTTLYSFCSLSECADGTYPESWLVQATNGDLYGTTGSGGNTNCFGGGCGTVFKITPSGVLTTLYSFCTQSGCADGDGPTGLVQTANGDLYGTTGGGGATVYDGGTVFKITPSGTLTTLYSFCSQNGCVDGSDPVAGLILANNGDLYGTTELGGTLGQGTVFKITPSGTLTALYSLHGVHPFPGTLMQATNGVLYGMTTFGGANHDGILFSLSVGLGPFVETQTTFGKVGEAVEILGTDLTGATSVSFNGTAAAFTVVGPSLIVATVPAGATSGRVEVGLPGGTLVSNEPFQVLP